MSVLPAADLAEKEERNRILINGCIISLGSIAVLDNIVSHWMFKWHRILPDENILYILRNTNFRIIFRNDKLEAR